MEKSGKFFVTARKVAQHLEISYRELKERTKETICFVPQTVRFENQAEEVVLWDATDCLKVERCLRLQSGTLSKECMTEYGELFYDDTAIQNRFVFSNQWKQHLIPLEQQENVIYYHHAFVKTIARLAVGTEGKAVIWKYQSRKYISSTDIAKILGIAHETVLEFLKDNTQKFNSYQQNTLVFYYNTKKIGFFGLEMETASLLEQYLRKHSMINNPENKIPALFYLHQGHHSKQKSFVMESELSSGLTVLQIKDRLLLGGSLDLSHEFFVVKQKSKSNNSHGYAKYMEIDNALTETAYSRYLKLEKKDMKRKKQFLKTFDEAKISEPLSEKPKTVLSNDSEQDTKFKLLYYNGTAYLSSETVAQCLKMEHEQLLRKIMKTPLTEKDVLIFWNEQKQPQIAYFTLLGCQMLDSYEMSLRYDEVRWQHSYPFEKIFYQKQERTLSTETFQLPNLQTSFYFKDCQYLTSYALADLLKMSHEDFIKQLINYLITFKNPHGIYLVENFSNTQSFYIISYLVCYHLVEYLGYSTLIYFHKTFHEEFYTMEEVEEKYHLTKAEVTKLRTEQKLLPHHQRTINYYSTEITERLLAVPHNTERSLKTICFSIKGNLLMSEEEFSSLYRSGKLYYDLTFRNMLVNRMMQNYPEAKDSFYLISEFWKKKKTVGKEIGFAFPEEWYDAFAELTYQAVNEQRKKK